MPVWEPETLVDEPLVRRLLGQFPELRVESLREVAAGWDNSLWLVDEEWAFRFPRRAIAIPGVERELELLPHLAPLLPLPVPAPVFVGRPAHGYPWPFFGARYLRGDEASADALTGVSRGLAGFLRTLHSLELGDELPVDFNRRTDMTARVPLAREQLAALERAGLWTAPPAVAGLLAEAERLLPPTETVLVHGDLHFRHVLIEHGRLKGVIDWGDVCRADRSADLLLFWNLAPAAREAFLEAYGEVTAEQLLRARVLAFSVNAALAAYGHAEGLADVEREALAGLERSTA